MSGEFDYGKIVVGVANAQIEKALEIGKDILKGGTVKIQLRLKRTYSNYLKALWQRNSKAKAFFFRNEPTDLYNFYVPLSLSCDSTSFPDANFDQLVGHTNHIVITGPAGSGKSVLIKHLLLGALRSKLKVPILIELRESNGTKKTLRQLMDDALDLNGFNLGSDFAEKAMASGHFAIFLDGFDEIEHSRRKRMGREIKAFGTKFEKNTIIVTSRPDDEFNSWQQFSIFDTEPLTLDQACALVEKIPFDVDIKGSFLSDLRARLYKEHESFLSNPLLLSIMLLTYGENADIPKKLSVFYDQAYSTLFQRHDALKGAYKRERKSQLDIQEFGKVLEAFCIQTYDKHAIQFSVSEAIDYLDKSRKLSSIDFVSLDYLADATQAVNMLVEDGLFLTFSHRSFQEYFAARFICATDADTQQRLLKQYAQEYQRRNVLRLIQEMSPDMFESQCVLPILDAVTGHMGLGREVGAVHYARFMKTFFKEVAYFEIDSEKHSSYQLAAVTYTSGTPNFLELVLDIYGKGMNFYQKGKDPGSSDDFSATLKKYGTTDGGILTVDITSVGERANFFQHLGATPVFPIDSLKSLADIRDELRRKHQLAHETLADILEQPKIR